MEYYVLENQTIIRKVGDKHLLLNTTFDYSKKKIMELSDVGEEIALFISKRKTLEDIKTRFPSIKEDVLIEFLRIICERGYAFKYSDSALEQKFVSEIVRNDWLVNRTFFACTMELLPNCNLKCVHCYLSDHRYEAVKFPKENVFKIVDELYDNGLLMIYLSGGEPLLRPDFLDIYTYIRKKGIMVTIFTNGSLITDEMIERFKEYPPLEVDISLYGSCEEKYYEVTKERGVFSRVWSNVLKLKDNGIYVSLKTPVISILEDDLENMVSLCKSNDLPYRIAFEINPTIDNISKKNYQIPYTRVAELMKKFSDEYPAMVKNYNEFVKDKNAFTKKKYLCSTGRCSFFITYEGKAASCIELRHKAVDILKLGFKDSWELCKKSSYETANPDNYKCSRCNMATICKSCPAIRERLYGDATIVKESDCAFAQALKSIIEKGE